MQGHRGSDAAPAGLGQGGDGVDPREPAGHQQRADADGPAVEIAGEARLVRVCGLRDRGFAEAHGAPHRRGEFEGVAGQPGPVVAPRPSLDGCDPEPVDGGNRRQWRHGGQHRGLAAVTLQAGRFQSRPDRLRDGARAQAPEHGDALLRDAGGGGTERGVDGGGVLARQDDGVEEVERDRGVDEMRAGELPGQRALGEPVAAPIGGEARVHPRGEVGIGRHSPVPPAAGLAQARTAHSLKHRRGLRTTGKTRGGTLGRRVPAGGGGDASTGGHSGSPASDRRLQSRLRSFCLAKGRVLRT